MPAKHKEVILTKPDGKALTLRDTVEIGPGVFVGGIPLTEIPRAGYATMLRRPDGSYIPVVKSFQPTIRLTLDIGRKLGIALDDGDGESLYHTIRRLIRAGFISARPLTDRVLRLDLNSFWEFWHDCAEPGFWTTERKEKLKAARYDLNP